MFNDLGLRVTFEFPDGRYDEMEVPTSKIALFLRAITEALESDDYDRDKPRLTDI